MMTMPAIVADELGKYLADDFRRLFGSSHQDEAERLDGIARVALECLGKSDALYHNVEHTFLVTLEPFPAIPSQRDSALCRDVACWLSDMEARHGTRLQSGSA
jgi:hypothetical protein